jgi:hypothetical protein
MPANLHEIDKREVFFRIVHLQDEGVSVEDSRGRMAEQFGIDVDDIREIESEGLAKDWPPL